ncbi:Transcriptional regulator, TetR family protein [Minicystis rosea]|nr:Transcriptional regulator, TetR family protein [Minicystis rosea]
MPKRRREDSLWLRTEPGARKPRLSRAKIAEVAVAIADREGFEAVSMRRVAEALEVGTMSLYYYVKTRAELMALMDDALMAEHLLPAVTKKGPKALLEIALGTHEMLVRHPWALVAMRGAEPGPNAMRHVEQCLETLSETKLSAKEKLTLLAMVDDYVFGHALRESESRAGLDEALAQAMLETGELPRVRQTFEHGRIEVDARRLRWGLEAIIGRFLPL